MKGNKIYDLKYLSIFPLSNVRVNELLIFNPLNKSFTRLLFTCMLPSLQTKMIKQLSFSTPFRSLNSSLKRECQC